MNVAGYAGSHGSSSDTTGGQGCRMIVELGLSMKDNDTRWCTKERVYWSSRICGQADQQLWCSLNTLMGTSDKNRLFKNCPSAQQFTDFFESKVAAVREATAASRSTTLAAVQQRIEYKVCVLVYKCLHQAAPTYLAELCSPVSESAKRGHLRSAARGNLAVPHCRTRYGHRCFAVSGPTLWNSLTLSVRDPSLTLTQFCARLKTMLFCRAEETLA